MRLFVSITIVLSIYGLYQLLYGYPNYFSYVENTSEFLLPATREVTREWLNALSGRVFSRFALPSQFAGYLLMMFPMQVLLILRERKAALKILWGLGFILNSVMFVYTKSFGAWLVFICLIAFSTILAMLQRRTITWQKLVTGTLIMLIAGTGMLYVIGILRGQHLWDFQGNNPLWYRLLNWKVALKVLRDHPFLGTGFSTFGTIYPQYMPSGANESHYAHNSYLQIGAESGLIGLTVTFWFVLAWGRMAFNMLKKYHPSPKISFADVRYACAFGALAFLLHNIIDFDFYVFPLGSLGVILLALTANPGTSRESSPQRMLGSLVISIGVGCVLMTGIVLDWQQSRAIQYSADFRIHLPAARYEEAAKAIRHALQAWPVQPEYQAFAGSLALYRKQPDSALRYFQAAIQTTPATPWFHAGLSEAYLASHNLSMAYLESRRAAELFPEKPAYQQRTQEIQNALSSF